MEQLTESVFPEKRLQYASFWSRLVAGIVDAFFVLMSSYLAAMLLGYILALVVILLVLCLYAPLMEGSARQATLGKTGMRLKVADMDGRRITYAQAFGRHFGKLVSMIIAFGGYFMMFGNDKRQTLHDRMARTLVITE